MPNDITSMLGKGKDDQAMSPEDETQLQKGMGLPNADDDGEGNPLEKMDKISKEKSKDNKGKGKKFDPDVLAQVLMTGDNTEGMFSPDEVEEDENGIKLHEDEDESMKKDLDKEAKPSQKYAASFQSDMMKHPDKYKIDTPQGEMTIAEALRKGYNPLTKQFEKDYDQDDIKEKYLSQLNDEDRSNLERITNPSAAQIAPADASKFGLQPDSPFVRQQPAQQMAPAQAMVPQGAPEQGMMPPQQPQGQVQGQAQPDISSLLGGGM